MSHSWIWATLAASTCATFFAAEANAVGWQEPSDALKETDLGPYFETVSPVLIAVRLTYTATTGSDYIPDEAADPGLLGLPGWSRLRHFDVDPKEGGLHALAFVHNETMRALLAFRGTDLGSGEGSLADSCADSLLWENLTWAQLPADCHSFPNATLDYLSAALHWRDHVLHELPGFDPLYTGHSLGAGLAVLVAASQAGQHEPKVMALSSPGFDMALQSRLHMFPQELRPFRNIVIYNEDDPIYFDGSSHHELFGSTACIFQSPGGQTPDCHLCYNGPVRPSFDRPECERCFLETHVLKNYLDALEGNASHPPLARPRCLSVAEAGKARLSQEAAVRSNRVFVV